MHGLRAQGIVELVTGRETAVVGIDFDREVPLFLVCSLSRESSNRLKLVVLFDSVKDDSCRVGQRALITRDRVDRTAANMLLLAYF